MSDIPLLKMTDVSYRYGGDSFALQEMSVSIFPGERVAVLGNNGAGKSTFFLCCNGVLAPASGTIQLEGADITRKKKHLHRLREAVGLVFQDPDDQILGATVEGEVSFGPMNLGLERSEVEASVNRALGAADLVAFRERPPHHLSGGEKKRVTIADILAMNARLILFDEPTSSLDPRNTIRLEETLNQLCDKGIALMLSTHDIDFAWSWAQRILVFHGGRLLRDDSAGAIFSDEALLQTAGLRKPLLYSATQAICSAACVPMPEAVPRTMETFNRYVKELYV